MTPERYEQIGQLYDAALELAPEERAAFIESVCGADEVLRQQVELLIEAHERAGDFIARPAFETLAELLTDEEAPTLVEGRRISHYHVLLLLGAGGMGEVYLAQDTKLGRRVALKLLPQKLTSDPERVRRFEREARAASALNHPNILTIYEVGRASGIEFIAAEFIEGETLRVHLAKTRMRLIKALDVAGQVSSALEVAHAAGVVHRDLKPENIMLRRDQIVKVLDFGLTKLIERAAPATQGRMAGSEERVKVQQVDTEPGLVLGTAQYMSPEQTRGSKLIDHRTDIWSLGVILYEMVAGRVPFEGADTYRRIISIQEHEPPPLAVYADDVPERLEEIVRKALAKDPDERYQTARDLLIDLRNLKRKLEVEEEIVRSSAHEWTSASGADARNSSQTTATTGQRSAASTKTVRQPQPTSSAEINIGEIKRHKRGFGVFMAVLILLTAGVAIGVYKWQGRDHLPNKGSTPAAKTIPFTSFPGVETEPSFSPDGHQLAFAWNSPGADNFDIYVKLLDTGAPLRLTTHPGEDRFPCWSPDGRHVAFIRTTENENAIALVPALGGPERVLHSVSPPSVRSLGHFLSWTPDGKSLAFSEKASPLAPLQIYLLSVETLDRRRLTSPPAATPGDSSPAVSPGGNTLAFIRRNNNLTSDIYLAPIYGGEATRLTSDNSWITGLAWTPDGREIIYSSDRAGARHLWKIPAAGGTPERAPAGEENPANPAIARQGRLLAYNSTNSDTNIWRMEVQGQRGASGSPPVKLISSTRADNSPQYSPDGKKFVFSSSRTGYFELWTCDADGSNPARLTSFNGPHVGTPRWSPDGREIVFDSTAEGHRDIYVMGAAGGRPRRLTTEPSTDTRPSWSRDGRFIYFGSDRSGEWQVWKSPAEGGQAVQVTKGGGREAFESPDGKFVYYTKENGTGLWRVPVEGGEEMQVLDRAKQGAWAVWERGVYFVDPQARVRPSIEFYSFATGQMTRVATIEKALLWTGPSLAASPDGRWILYVQVDQTESDIMLVENFS